MRKRIVALLIMLCLTLSLGQGNALAATIDNTRNQGAQAAPLNSYQDGCTPISDDKGIITTDVNYNCSVVSPTIRVRYAD